MSKPRNRSELRQWIRRELGEPVISLNVADSQIDDRIEDAYDFWKKYHYKASRREYIAHLLTQDEADTRRVTLPDDIISVTRVYPIGTGAGSNNDQILFNTEYQLVSDALSITGDGITNYVLTKQYVDMVRDNLTPEVQFRFTETESILFMDTNDLLAGNYILIECHLELPLDQYPKIFEDRSFRLLATAYTRRQWGRNLIKMTGIQLPGGGTINGDALIAEADKDIEKLENDFMLRNAPPDLFFVG